MQMKGFSQTSISVLHTTDSLVWRHVLFSDAFDSFIPVVLGLAGVLWRQSGNKCSRAEDLRGVGKVKVNWRPCPPSKGSFHTSAPAEFFVVVRWE